MAEETKHPVCPWCGAAPLNISTHAYPMSAISAAGPLPVAVFLTVCTACHKPLPASVTPLQEEQRVQIPKPGLIQP